MITKLEFALSVRIAYTEGSTKIRGLVNLPKSADIIDQGSWLSASVDEINAHFVVQKADGKCQAGVIREPSSSTHDRSLKQWADIIEEALRTLRPSVGA